MKIRDVNRVKSFDGGSSKGSLDMRDKPTFKKKFSNQVLFKFPTTRDDKVSNPKSQKGRVLVDKPRRQILNSVERSIMVISSLRRTITSVVARVSNVRDCPNFKGQDSGSGQAHESGCNVNVPKKNHFYAVRFRGEQDISPDMVTVMLKLFSIDVYALIDPNATLSFVTALVARQYDILPDILNEPFSVTKPSGLFSCSKNSV